MANWSFKQLASGQWGTQGYFPKGESAPYDEELLGKIVQVSRKDGTSQTKRITGIEGWFKAPQGWATVRCEFEDAEPEPEGNGVHPNLPSAPPSAPPSAQEIGIALYTPDGVFRTWLKADLWQPSPEMIKSQEVFESMMHEKLLNGIPYSVHTRHQVENGYPDKCACQFCRINDPFFGQAKDDKEGGYGE